MGYYIDLEKISLEQYGAKLVTAYLPPSRMMLKERLEERFNHFKTLGIHNLKALQESLKKKDQWAELSKIDCFSGDYLTILLRELNSMLPKPNKINEFSGIRSETIEKLEILGIKNTLKLFDAVKNKKDRKELAKKTGLNYEDIMELTHLTDLSRIKWVGVSFARMLCDIGLDTVEKATMADPEDLHRRINTLNQEKKIFRGQIGLNDIRIFVEAAKEVPLEIEYEE